MAAEYLQTHGIDLQSEIDRAQYGDSKQASTGSAAIRGVRVLDRPPSTAWDIGLENGRIGSIDPFEQNQPQNPKLDASPQLVLPSLCHPHIHLDKCFLLSHPKYDDLEILNGNFQEALELTSRAKERFDETDLLERGTWLIKESITAGVTVMRCFVEVDTTVQFRCLDAGLKLKDRFADRCEIQICVFAQDPLFSTEKNQPNGRKLMEQALSRDGVDALGSTPYVEDGRDLMQANVDWAIAAAVTHDKHLDLHLDYNVDSANPPLINYVLAQLHNNWGGRKNNRTIVLGHCSRLTLFNAQEWEQLKTDIADLPVYFVGLPSSDLFMMGRPQTEEGGGQRIRGTLQIPQMIEKYGLKGAVGVNNVGNAFTPQGSVDPLNLASIGVGIYQAGTKAGTRILYDCVSSGAKTAIGYPQPSSPFEEGAEADFLIIQGKSSSQDGSSRIPRTLQEAVYHPPQNRQTIKGGRAC